MEKSNNAKISKIIQFYKMLSAMEENKAGMKETMNASVMVKLPIKVSLGR